MTDTKLIEWLAENILGWEKKMVQGEPHWVGDFEATPVKNFKPTQNIQDAWMLIDKLREEGRTFKIYLGNIPKPYCKVSIMQMSPYVLAEHENFPMAISLAVAKAAGYEVEDE